MRLRLLIFLIAALLLPQFVFSAITFVNSASAVNNASGASLAAGPISLTSGNLVVVGIVWTGAVTVNSVTDTAGNTYVQCLGCLATVGTDNTDVWYSTNITGNASGTVTVSFSAAATFRGMAVHQYSGAGAFEVGAHGSSASASSVATSSFSPAASGNLNFGMGHSGGTPTWTAGNGFTLRISLGTPSGTSEDLIGAPAGSQTASISISSAQSIALAVASFKTGTPTPSITATGGTPQSTLINTAFPAQLQATVKDANNNPMSGVSVTFTAPSSGPSGTFTGGTTTASTNASGIATAAVFTANGTGGSYTVTATASGIPGQATFSLSNLSGGKFPISSSANHRYFVDGTGSPWLMVGDSAHTAICALPQSSWAAYFQDRQNNGFNTIDILAGDVSTGCTFSSGAAADGTLPFTTGTGPSTYDLSTPNSAFWAEVDSFVNTAATYGMVVSIDPLAWGNGFAVTYQNNGATKAFNFGAYLGSRYKNFTNIVWHVGQDFDKGSFPSSSNLNLIAQLMAGIASTDPNHLITCQLNYTKSYSTQANSSNSTYNQFLNTNFVYTYFEVYDYILAAYNSSPTLPVILGETNYETGNNTGALSSGANAFITRQEMWYAMASGASGHIFGNEHVNHFDSSYQSNLDTTATFEVKYLTQLFNTFSWWTFAPDTAHALVTAGYGSYNGNNGNMYNATYATTAWDGANSSVTYTPVSTTLTVDMAKFSKPVSASWYDPTTGTSTAVSGSPFTNSGSQNFTTPSAAHSDGTNASDWVLVLLPVANLPAPPTNLKAVVQ